MCIPYTHVEVRCQSSPATSGCLTQTFGESFVFASHLEMAVLELRRYGGVREIAYWLRALVTLAENLGLVPTPTW